MFWTSRHVRYNVLWYCLHEEFWGGELSAWYLIGQEVDEAHSRYVYNDYLLVPSGARHWLKRGFKLPCWVRYDHRPQLAEMVMMSAIIFKFDGRICSNRYFWTVRMFQTVRKIQTPWTGEQNVATWLCDADQSTTTSLKSAVSNTFGWLVMLSLRLSPH